MEHFELVLERNDPELRGPARLWRHRGCGTQVLSFCNQDENKVFGVSLRTPPPDSTGLPHILEHSVLCGSSKYPVREPFVELLKGSLQTFLNAFTYPDKTCYPVASANLQDFYNLVNVYIDAVFHPRLAESVFQQEGWHVEAEAQGGERRYAFKGVVYNEMKGAFSSPESVLERQALHGLFPDSPYGLESGGDPQEITKLAFADFVAFHRRYYHPSNARFFFWGDDPEAERLRIVHTAVKGYDRAETGLSLPPLQPRFAAPRAARLPYAAGEGAKAIFTLNWMLQEADGTPSGVEYALAAHMLEHILIGMPASPLSRALLESGLGEDLAGGGLEDELRQHIFSIGLKGVDEDKAGRVEGIIMRTLEELTRQGIPPASMEAAINSVEFDLRENNTGRFPVGLAVMLRSLSCWLYSDDPKDGAALAPLCFEAPLRTIKAGASGGYFERMLRSLFLDNPHRLSLLLYPDRELGQRQKKEEEERLQTMLSGMDEGARAALAENTARLKRLQETPDPPEALASIPRLKLEDLPLHNREIPQRPAQDQPVPVYVHPQPTSGICYLEAHLDPLILRRELLPLLPLLGRAMLEMGNREHGEIELNMEIARKTGGMDSGIQVFARLDDGRPVASLCLSGKATLERAEDLFRLSAELALKTNLDDRERFLRLLQEEKARLEHGLIPAGHQVVAGRMRASLSPAGQWNELLSGISYLEEVRGFCALAESAWPVLLARLEETRTLLLRRGNLRLSITAEEEALPRLEALARSLALEFPSSAAEGGPQGALQPAALPACEALLTPAQVNYAGKGVNLYAQGYAWHGSALVALKYLRTGWLWEKVRVQGGAYGVSCSLDRAGGDFCLVSYRDPDFRRTLRCFDDCADYLRSHKPDAAALEASIVGAIGEIDAYLLPEAKGSLAYKRAMSLDSPEERSRLRREVLETRPEHLTILGEALARAIPRAVTVVMGGQDLEAYARQEKWSVNRVL
ncbi:MAG: insulinase family protein [Deltaproteobacteria bacterium]|jgi:Zn-dependent M16 (insulinase) family peptidase|nr:insulinase family protein [Deltaproteobacteria bacterium]